MLHYAKSVHTFAFSGHIVKIYPKKAAYLFNAINHSIAVNKHSFGGFDKVTVILQINFKRFYIFGIVLPVAVNKR